VSAVLYGQDLSKALISDRRNDQDALANDPTIHPDLLVASVDEQAGIAFNLERAIAPRLKLSVELPANLLNMLSETLPETLPEQIGSSGRHLWRCLDLGRDRDER
jgi:hypothetical protein